MTDETTDTDQKEQHRLGTANMWPAPDDEWTAHFDWTRYRGPDPWPVPGGWVFKTPEEGGWWEYFGETGVGHDDDDSIREALKADNPDVNPDDGLDGALDADLNDALENARTNTHAHLSCETANPDEVSIRDYSNEKLAWTFELNYEDVFTRVDPSREDLMANVAAALMAYHESPDDPTYAVSWSTGELTAEAQAEQELEKRASENRGLGEFQ